MRKLTVPSWHFDTFLFPMVGNSTAESEGEFEVALRLLRKLKDPVLTVEKELSPAEDDARKKGTPVFPFFKLREAEATFLLDEDEYNLLKKRITANKTRVSVVTMDDFDVLLKVIAAAPVVKAETVTEVGKD